MRVLLDECLPRKLKNLLAGHDCTTAPEKGWAGIKNGNLMRLAESEFDIFLTVDRNLSFQNPIPDFDIGVVVIKCKSNRLDDLRRLVPQVLAAFTSVQKGHVVVIG
jgi:hypothetical protein